MANILEVDHGHGDVQRFPWDNEIRERFHLEAYEVEHLEAGELLWRGDTVFDLLAD